MHENDLEPSGPHGSGYYESLTAACSRRKPKREESNGEEGGRGGGWGSEVPTYDSHDPLVNIGRRDGSWESARGENKDTRCSGTDNDRRPADRPREAARNAATGRGDLRHSRHFCRRRG